jgi:SOS-response transcriptional repressor LexA
VQAGAFQEPIDPYAVGDAEEWLPIPRRAGARAYALRVRGASMEPRYLEGDVIFVDPDMEPRHGNRVVVRLENTTEVTFKELVVEGERRFLKALNPSWPDPLIEIKGAAVYCGVVIGKWTPE